MITDPRFAPRRNDLPWLRRRRLPKSATNPTPPPPAPMPPPSKPAPKPAPTPSAPTRVDPPLREFITGHATHHAEHEATPPAPASASSSLDLDAPRTPAPPARPPVAPPARAGAGSSLDLDAPSPPTPAPASSRGGASTSLDLDAPSTPAAPASSSSLDLDEAPAPRPAAPRAATPQRRRRVDQRVRSGERFILTPSDPTVTLTPLQSGIGSLTIEAAVSDEVGDLRLGCAYEFDLGTATPLELTMQMTQGNRFAPPHSKRPLLLGSRDRFEKVSVDLRQCRSLKRLVVYAFSESRRPLAWGGTLIVTTYGGARVEVPLESLQGGQIAVLLSIYRVRGELVLRAEMQALNGDVREASRAYGYDRITWLDDRTPVE